MPVLHPNTSKQRIRHLARQGAAIKDARDQAGLSQPKAAEALGVPVWTFRSWEKGLRGCPAEVRARIVAGWGGSEKLLGPEADVCKCCGRPW